MERITYAVIRRARMGGDLVRVIQEPTGHNNMCVIVDEDGRIGMVMPELLKQE